jgi:hypothetical protein
VSEIGLQFQELVAEFFRRNAFNVQQERPIANREFRVDMIISSKDGGSAVVETKLFRSRQVATQTIKNIASGLEAARRGASASKAILVMTARLDPLGQAELRTLEHVVIYDFDRLVWLLTDYPDLAARLDEILQDAHAYGNATDTATIQKSAKEKKPFELKTLTKIPKPSEIVAETKGQDLCAAIQALVEARETASAHEKRGALAKEFETLCTQALKYLFDGDLVAFRAQSTTGNRLSRFDLIARIRSNSEFWVLLVSDFSARYVVFEFKFYGEPIGQGEILTTEKYLYRAALRSVAIVISPLGADEHALESARGALREHGKLIINLNVDQVCRMLHAKDGTAMDPEGLADVEEELFKTLDDMLVRIER